MTRKTTQKILEVITKNKENLSNLNRRWRISFKAYLTQTELVDRLFSYSVELHKLSQDFFYAVHKRNQKHFYILLTHSVSLLQLLIKQPYEPLENTKNRFIMRRIILIRIDNWSV